MSHTVDTSTVNNGQSDDLVVANTATIAPLVIPTGNRALIVSGQRAAVNFGSLFILGNADQAAAVELTDASNATLGGSAAFSNSGLIHVGNGFQAPDTDGDGDPDGPFATGIQRAGIEIDNVTGNVENTSSGTIEVNGQFSFGIIANGTGTVDGNIINDGKINVLGESSIGIIAGGDVNGDIRVGGDVTVTGPAATGIRLARVGGGTGTPLISGGLELSGNLTVSGFRFTTPPADVSHLDADDLNNANAAVEIASSVAGGIHLTSSGNVRGLGAVGLQLDSGTTPNLIGPVAGETHGVVIDGSLVSDGLYSGKSGVGILINSGGSQIAGGILINGTVSARSDNSHAEGILDLTGKTIAPEIRNNGQILANSTGTAGSAAGIALSNTQGGISAIRNTGIIQAVATGGRIASGISSASNALTLIENSGTISATGAVGQGSNAAIDVSQETADVTIRQIAAAAGKPGPQITGDVNLGSGNDLVDIQAGTVTGDVNFIGGGTDNLRLGAGTLLTGNINGGASMLEVDLADARVIGSVNSQRAATINLAGASQLRGDINVSGTGGLALGLAGTSSHNGLLNVIAGGGANVQLLDQAQHVGNAIFGDGGNQVFLSGDSTFNGSIASGAGSDIIIVSDRAVLTAGAAGIDLGNGDDSITLNANAMLNGSVNFRNGADTVALGNQTKLNGSLSFTDGGDMVTLAENASLTGNVGFAGGNNRLLLGGNSILTGKVNAVSQGGPGTVLISLTQGAAIVGDLNLGQSAVVALTDSASIRGGTVSSSGAASTLITLADNSSLNGPLSLLGSGANGLGLTGHAQYVGQAAFGAGGNQINLSGDATFSGGIVTGGGADRIGLADRAVLTAGTAGIDLGDGVDSVVITDSGVLNGSVNFRNGSDIVSLFNQAKLNGNLNFTDGGDSIGLSDSAAITGNLTFSGTGGTTTNILLQGASKITGNVTLSSNQAAVRLLGTSLLNGRLDLGGGTDLLSIGTGARLLGSLTGGQNSTLNLSGTLDLTNIGNVALAALNVTNGGTLTVNLDGATGSATHYIVSGVASFGAGSKLLLRPIGMFGSSEHLALITAGSITGGDNLTANQIDVPFLFKTIALTRSATEIGLDLVRKSGAELGLNRSGTIALDPIFAAANNDVKVGTALANINDAPTLAHAVASLLPDHAGGTFETVTAGTRALARHVADGSTATLDHDHWALWMDNIYFNSKKSTGETAAYRATGWGLAGGAEVKTGFGNLGASVGYIDGNDRNADTASNKVTAKQYEGSVYYRGAFGGLRPYAWVSDAHVKFDSNRLFSSTIGTEPVVRSTAGNWTGNLLSIESGLSYEHQLGAITIRPNVSLDYNRLHEKGYQEHGGGGAVDLTVNGRTSDEFAGTATLALGIGSVAPERSWFKAEIEGGRRERFAGELGTTTAHFAGGSNFTLLPDDRESGWVGRARLSAGHGRLRLSGEVSAEEQNDRTNFATRATLQLSL